MEIHSKFNQNSIKIQSKSSMSNQCGGVKTYLFALSSAAQTSIVTVRTCTVWEEAFELFISAFISKWYRSEEY
jgi:hypothetical protein